VEVQTQILDQHEANSRGSLDGYPLSETVGTSCVAEASEVSFPIVITIEEPNGRS